MAGDWLKFDKATPDKPEVFAIAADLGIDPDAVVGKLMRIWSWFDTHTTDGDAARVTPALLDRCAGVTGFVTAMQKTGWIEVSEKGCTLPNFSRHCGETAKKRGLGAARMAALRGRDAGSVTSASPEKRREEKSKREAKAVAPEARPTRLPMDWTLPAEWEAYCRQKRPDLDPIATSLDFAEYWQALAGKGAVTAHWNLRWQTWVRRQHAPRVAQAKASDPFGGAL